MPVYTIQFFLNLPLKNYISDHWSFEWWQITRDGRSREMVDHATSTIGFTLPASGRTTKMVLLDEPPWMCPPTSLLSIDDISNRLRSQSQLTKRKKEKHFCLWNQRGRRSAARKGKKLKTLKTISSYIKPKLGTRESGIIAYLGLWNYKGIVSSDLPHFRCFIFCELSLNYARNRTWHSYISSKKFLQESNRIEHSDP